ncbi:AAA family ATPase [Priestia megaterium]
MKDLDFGLNIGDKITNPELTRKFKCSFMGGMRRSHKTNSLVLISDYDDIKYPDMKKDNDGTFLFVGMGQEGDQSLSYAQNRTIYYSNKNDINLYLFQKENKLYEFLGRVLLAEEPIKTKDKTQQRDIILFRLVLIGRYMDIRSFLSSYSIKELVSRNILSLNRQMLSMESVEPLIELMEEENIDTLLGPGGWFLSSKRYYFNNNAKTGIHNGKIQNPDCYKYIFKDQNTTLNPFYSESINYILDKENKELDIISQQELERENFRLVHLEVDSNDSYSLCVDFVSEDKEYKNNFPFTTLIIGANGTRKSTILSYIQKIFDEAYTFRVGKKKSYDILSMGYFKLKYTVGNREYTIEGEGKKRTFYLGNDKISFDRLSLPNKTIVSTYSVNDRFTQRKDPSILEKSHYDYLGMRTTKTQINLNKLSERVFLNILRSSIESDFLNDLNSLTDFLKLDPFLKLNIKLENGFHNLIKNIDSLSDSKLLNKNITYQEIVDLDNLMNYDPHYYDFMENNNNTLSITIDLKDSEKYEKQVDIFYSIINFVHKRILTFDSLMIKKEEFFNIESASSGENHFFVTMVNILSRIQDSSLIIIDEPEISLHPNWQLKYIRAMRNIFKKYATCHFIMATHSHFLVADLTPSDSSIVSMQSSNNSDENMLYSKDTFGWSTENILYNIFHVKTPQNYYIESELTELLGLISNKSQDLAKIKDIIYRLSLLPLHEDDPTRLILNQASRYVDNAELK